MVVSVKHFHRNALFRNVRLILIYARKKWFPAEDRESWGQLGRHR